MTGTKKERIYRRTLENTRDRLDGFQEQYADKEVYSAFDELTGLVEKGLKQASEIPSTADKLSVEKLQEQLNNLVEENNKLRNALEDIRTNTPIQELLDLPFGCSCHEIASEALAAIGGDDD